MIRRLACFFFRLVPLSIRRRLPRNITKHLWFVGIFNLSVSDSAKVKLHHEGYQLENEMFWYGLKGCHEAKSHQLVNDFLTTFKPANFFDVGASTGTYGIIAKKILPTCKIFFFEPQEKALDILYSNLELNSISAQVHEVAVSDYCGLGKMYYPADQRFVYSVTVNRNMSPLEISVQEKEINVVRFDSLKFELAGDINFFKLDAEYHEREVLSGFERTVDEVVKLNSGWLIEVLTDELGQFLESYFQREKFNYYDVDEEGFSVIRRESIRKSSNLNYFIVSKEMAHRLSSLNRQ